LWLVGAGVSQRGSGSNDTGGLSLTPGGT
jgi:hypothetical protein